MSAILDEALQLHSAGYCVLPIKVDGSKNPDLFTWKEFKLRRPTLGQLRRWFEKPKGICVIGGPVSQRAEFLDFDDHEGRGGVFHQWVKRLPIALVHKMVIYRTPSNGWRVAYRCEECFPGAKLVLAKRTKIEPLIELLAAQVAIVPGGDVRAHPDRKPYSYIRGHLAEVQTISPEERSLLIETSKTFNLYHAPERPRASLSFNEEIRMPSNWFASDDFNQRGNWDDILEPHGWKVVGVSGDVTLWRRPGKNDGISATTNYAGLDLLHVFSSSTEFEPDRSYSKYAAYAILNWDSDFSTAAIELARLGYGRANLDLSYFNEQLKGIYDLSHTNNPSNI